MREVAFIKKNKEKWLNFEAAIFSNQFKDADELAALYIQLVNDLSYAQTYYKKSKLITYLNGLACQSFLKIYKTKQDDSNRLVQFFKMDVPLLMYQYRRYVLYAFILFGVSVAIGAVSAAHQESFVRLVFSDAYVNMTLENIEKGDPVAVYKNFSNWGGFFVITLNNLYVSIRVFIFGVTGGLVTGYVLIKEGIRLGAFQYFFYEQGVLWESVRGIWIHGAMEIFSIVIAGAAGLVLGASILFPKTHSRKTSFKTGVNDGLKILASTVPFFIFAGFLEGFVTRFSNAMPNFMSVAIILTTLFFISWYYLVYPFWVFFGIRNQESGIRNQDKL